MAHRLLCLLMHGRTSQPTANPCVSLPAPQCLLLSQRISFPISSPSQHILGHWALIYWTGLTWPPHSVRDQLSMCALSSPLHRHQAAAVPSCVPAPHRRSQTARNHPLWNFFLHCLPSNHTPFHILSFLPPRKALPVRGELFCCFPAGKLHVGTSHSQPEC